MGAGASTGVTAATQSASPEEIRKVLAGLSEADRNKLRNALEDGEVEACPPSCKALFAILQTAAGPDMTPANPKLKMLLTSAGLMPTSAPELLERYATLQKATPGNGVLYLMDAKLKTLQWPSSPSDPVKDNGGKYVTYRREPEEKGGTPVLDADSKPVPKGQSELASYGYHSVEYALRQNHHYSNGHLDVVAAGAEGEAVPVYLSYLGYAADGLDADGKPRYTILLAKGQYKDGVFSLEKADGSGEFSEVDFDAATTYTHEGNAAFKKVSDAEFKAAVDSVSTVWSCGGVTWLTVLNLQPFFVDDGKVLSTPNPYGKTILDAVKAGEVVYVGQSAGSVAMSYNIGPLTTDPADLQLEMDDEDGAESINLNAELGKKMLQPGLGVYLGMPYRLIFRPHLTFKPDKVGYAGKALATRKLAEMLTDGVGADASHNIYCAITADYNFKKGMGDVVEIADGNVSYHVGYCDEASELPASGKAVLEKLHPEFAKANGSAFRKQPPNNDPRGRAFTWAPANGDVVAAGPGATKPFHLAVSSEGPMTTMAPY
uniref:Uncharacterized protein n=1 Tax=Haptolina brevifila TaxID=156173 RepID=A0A7S2C0B7_9EUKA|mmetsp:Transcript_18840/g.38306  ORF Transcript_18840/g.38306 Transcript_18840/m.38306 type:complete len:545 (+) Transcript_18840:61-1695(+)|eukprot:CAMPEP_0174698826 /NCGR_PEP_ID=MMETSP1094-20130205/4304_1 /TAXON_ID=156173 /ORGANISM="Chrysochromulina brevifilum, Strain UTEX LB 985" /LENGTH=544 /DNA_ID=CAMNT_0015896059 /DNA_START=51 /DNA_END=1685 /DNA_ORIENTATION=-